VRGKERALLSSHHPAFRRHDGRHTLNVATQQQQTLELRRIRSSSGVGVDIGYTSTNVDMLGNFETDRNPLHNSSNSSSNNTSFNNNATFNYSSPTRAVRIPIQPQSQPRLRTTSSQAVVSQYNQFRLRATQSVSPTKRRAQHIHAQGYSSQMTAESWPATMSCIAPTTTTTANAGTGTGTPLSSATFLVPKRYAFSHVVSATPHHDFPRRVDLSRQHKTTQTLRFYDYLRPDQFPLCESLSLHTNSLTLIDRLCLTQRFHNLLELGKSVCTLPCFLSFVPYISFCSLLCGLVQHTN
jgi:hypothetical protein